MIKIWNYLTIHVNNIVLFHQIFFDYPFRGRNLNDFSGALFFINEFLQLSIIFDYGNALIISSITSGFVVLSTKTKMFLQRIKDGWNKIVNSFLMLSLSHLLTLTNKKITIKCNGFSKKWVQRNKNIR